MTPAGPADTYDYSQRAGAFAKFLWRCAGCDEQLLARSPHADRVKFQGLGGIVLATTILAFVSAWYALYTVFGPRGATALEDTALDVPWTVGCGVGALLWALVIFNIDRFIISSTGKGDGSDQITFRELWNSLPRLAMATIIGLCISAPLEIRILKTEIDAELASRQMDLQREYNKKTEALVESGQAEVQVRIDALQKDLDARPVEFEKRRQEILEQRRKLELEAEGASGTGRPGRGPAWQDKSENLKVMERELEESRKTATEQDKPKVAEIERLSGELNRIATEVTASKDQNAKRAANLDGLMARIHISHEIGGYVPIAIMLLLLFVEICPIFFKMQLVTGCYDYLQENQKRMAAARWGVEPANTRREGAKEIEIEPRFHQAEGLLSAEVERLKTEDVLTRKVHEEFRVAEAAKIAENPDRYLKTP